MDRYSCTMCGYMYIPEEGDPENNVKPDTPFGDLPATWRCPTCEGTKAEFDAIDY